MTNDESEAQDWEKAGQGLPPELREYLQELYRGAWEAYTAAGSPFGPTDDAMLIWYEFDRQTRNN